MDGGETGQGAAAGEIPLPCFLTEGPIHSQQEGWWESVVGLKRDAEAWLGAPWEGVGPYRQLVEMVSLVGDSNCLGQIQLRQSTANISPGFRWGKEGGWVNLSFKATQISEICVCLMPRSTQSPLEDRGWFCQGEMLLEKCGLVVMFLTSPWAERCREGFDLMDHLLWLCQPPASAASKGEAGGLRPALVVAPLQGKCGPLNCVLADDLLFMHMIYLCSPAPVTQRTWTIWSSKSFLNPSLRQA